MKFNQLVVSNKFVIPILIFIFCSTLILGFVTGSAHDFSASGWNSSNEICIVCHTPHDSDMTVNNSPLWNHEVTSATFTVYYSPTMDVVPNQPQGVSRLCLSCHDGTIALDSFGGNTGSTNISGTPLIGINLGNDHPVSIDWQHQTNDLGGSSWCANCHDMMATPTFISKLEFFDGNIECATCHDVHNSTGIDKLLRVTALNSEICLSCHNK